jgi:hypothetical protein
MCSAASDGWCVHPFSSAKMGASRDLPTPDLQPRPSVSSSRGRMLLCVNKSSSGAQSSATWTSTSGDLVSDTDEIDNREAFVNEYNRLARKVHLLALLSTQVYVSY